MRKVGRKIFMAKAKFFLDTRRTKPGAPSVLKVAISQRTKTAYLSLSARLFPNQWDDEHSMVVNHPEQQLLNLYIGGVKQQVDRTIFILADNGGLQSMTAIDIKTEIERKLNPEKVEEREQKERRAKLFAARFKRFAESKKASTCGVYMQTYRRMRDFIGETALNKLSFEDITREWLGKFEAFLAKTAPSKNARNIHLRNIRAVFNEAIDDELTTAYPFRRYDVRPVATRKRNLKVEDLRTLFEYPCEEYAVKYLDMFKLMFMLIGINAIDLYNLKRIEDGRVSFNRSKTNRLYSIKRKFVSRYFPKFQAIGRVTRGRPSLPALTFLVTPSPMRWGTGTTQSQTFTLTLTSAKSMRQTARFLTGFSMARNERQKGWETTSFWCTHKCTHKCTEK